MNQPVTILLVEDDKSMLNGISDLLQTIDIGFKVKVLTAGDGKAGLDAMVSATPDLIVSDIMMPRMDGYQFLEAVRENPEWLQIPFIFLTAQGERKEITRGKMSGADLYITKPFATKELLELIQSQLNKSFKRLNTRQQHVKSLKKSILQILNHEFRTPLTYVTAYYEMLADSLMRFSEGDDFQEYLHGIQAGCVRLTHLVDDLIQVIELNTGETGKFYRAEATKVENLPQLVEQVINEYQGTAATRNISLEFTSDSSIPNVLGHPESLKKAFACLLDNAIKFTSSGGSDNRKVTVSLHADKSSIYLDFKDEGVGFPQKVKSQLFELFFQYNRSLTEQQGAGVGLNIAQGLIELHQGKIEAVSEEDNGSTFTIVLPIYQPDRKNVSAPTKEVKRLATVLIVEDEQFLLAGLKELLELFDGRYQLKVLTASNGRKGLAVLEQHRPDLIISDIMMPYLDGFEFLEKVRQNPDWLHIPFIFLTAKGERLDIHRGFLIGAEEYITKPYDSEELLGLVTKRLDRHFQVQTLLAHNFDDLKEGILKLITPDFRLPLTSVTNFSEKLAAGLEETQTPEELKKSLRGIQFGSTRLTNLVEDFISLAELKTGEAEIAYNLRAQPIYNLDLVFIEMGQIVGMEADKLGINIICPLSQDLPPIFGDSSMIIESAKRLLKIGIWYCQQKEEERRIFLEVANNQSEAYLSVRFRASIDPGAIKQFQTILGQDSLDALELFEFAPTLNIAKGYIALNNGRIQLSQDDDNITFTITLPVYKTIINSAPPV